MTRHANARIQTPGAAAKLYVGALLGSKRRTYTASRTATQARRARRLPATWESHHG
jgi:hypothetical protein